MNDPKELEEYLDIRPKDHQTRWRLAKKYYRQTQYQEALGHLEILKDEWTPKINVWRYLAAVNYRLGFYDQAIAVLSDAIKEWPEEIPAREQLARVLEAAGRRDAAAAVWREILRQRPSYDSAHDALERLPKNGDIESRPLEDHDFGIERSSGLICGSCGTLNTDEFERCWKCHSLLLPSQAAPPQEPKASVDIMAQADQQRRELKVVGAMAVLVLVIVIYLTARFHSIETNMAAIAPTTVL